MRDIEKLAIGNLQILMHYFKFTTVKMLSFFTAALQIYELFLLKFASIE
jgi:hypothetical protein